MIYDFSLVWFRRDLRIADNTALSRASAESARLAGVFVFDSEILRRLQSKSDARVTFIYDSVVELAAQFNQLGLQFFVIQGDPRVEIPAIATRLKANAVYFNEDYEPAAKSRDAKVKAELHLNHVACHSFKDHVIFSENEINKPDASPYKMFTPYKKVWLKKIKSSDYAIRNTRIANSEGKSVSPVVSDIPSLNKIGFVRAAPEKKAFVGGRSSGLTNLKKWSEGLKEYAVSRDFPGLEQGTSSLSVHLRFGTISIREGVSLCMQRPSKGAEVWLSELIWRDFYQMILGRFPHVVKGAFKTEYDHIQWSGEARHFESWCQGRTGFPIVDAGMRQLNKLGWMHNRLRMITASFLVKDLLVDWRKGEAYFAEKLLDFDLAANNGGWQWCASTGCDAQPYFRIFNPVLQSEKFDPDCKFIKEWVPELKNLSPKEIHMWSLGKPAQINAFASDANDYLEPIVDHSQQKVRALQMYQAGAK